MDLLPLVSIIIPVYNSESTIVASINSILNQSYRNLEILIADDGSKDLSQTIIDNIEDKRVKRYHNDSNIGYLMTCNKLFNLSNGDLITFQDADDISVPNRIKLLVTEFVDDSELGLCGSNFVRIDTNGDVLSVSNFTLVHEDILTDIEKRIFPFCGATVMIRRKVFDAIGGYRLFYDRLGYEDHDWIMLISEQFKTKNIPDILYQYRYSASSVSRIGLQTNYKKFYNSEIAFFLRDQRKKYGKDGLQAENLKEEFDKYLAKLKYNFENDRYAVYRRVLLNRFLNEDFSSAFSVYKEAIKEKNVKLKISLLFIWIGIKSGIKYIIKYRR